LVTDEAGFTRDGISNWAYYNSNFWAKNNPHAHHVLVFWYSGYVGDWRLTGLRPLLRAFPSPDEWRDEWMKELFL
jgi:hypothetical protein